ncbi:MAG TPA: hypothetical protein VFQ86_05915 [Arachidicoccus soli]|nr:hypothetical protein [Arachidicoccus soli]
MGISIKTIGGLTNSRTHEFQHAVFLNDSAIAYAILDDINGPGGWYPESEMTAWTDIAVLEDEYYAVFGMDSVSAQNAYCQYIQIEPTESMISEYEYFKQY